MVDWRKYKKYLIPAGVIGGLAALGILAAPKAPPEKVEEAKKYAEEKGYDWSIVGQGTERYLIQGYTIEDAVETAFEDLTKITASITSVTVNGIPVF